MTRVWSVWIGAVQCLPSFATRSRDPPCLTAPELVCASVPHHRQQRARVPPGADLRHEGDLVADDLVGWVFQLNPLQMRNATWPQERQFKRG